MNNVYPLKIHHHPVEERTVTVGIHHHPVEERTVTVGIHHHPVEEQTIHYERVEVSERALEARARRRARAVGYVARKDRSPNPLVNCGGFMIVDPATNFPVAGFQYDLSAEAVLAWCEEPA